MAKKQNHLTLSRQAAKMTVPLFVGVCLLLGGASAPGLSVHLWLQLAGLAVLGICLWNTKLFSIPENAYPYFLLACVWIAYGIIQIIPLPAMFREMLPGGQDIARGFEMIESSMPAMPLSLSPAETLYGLMMVIPPLAIFMLMMKLSWRSITECLIWAIPFIGVLSVLIGVAQLSGGRDSTFYFYSLTNLGSPVGLFSNINHQAIFLLMTLPFLSLLIANRRVAWMSGDHDPAIPVFIGGMALVLIAGILMAGSMAGYALLLPTSMLSAALIFGRRRIGGIRWRYALPVVAVVGVGITYFVMPPMLEAVGLGGQGESELSRSAIWLSALPVLARYWIMGAGLGAFPDIYALFENPTDISNVYVNHAHNDYLEWFIELGLIGALLVAAFFALAIRETVRVWQMKGGQEVRIKRAASIALWLPFLHSFVDYPLRTPAVAVMAAVCLAIMLAPPERSARSRKTENTDQPKRMSKQVEI